MLEPILQGIGFGLIMALSVGPTIFAVLKYSISYGYKAGLSYILGVSISDLMYVSIANAAASLLVVANEYQKSIGIAGSVLIIIMGIYGLFKKLVPKRNTNTLIPIGVKGASKIFLSGFFMNTLNPGVLLTWLGMVSLVSDKGVGYRTSVFVTALVLVLGVDVLKVVMANKVRKLLTPRNVIKLQRFSAVCLLVVGVFILIKFLLNVQVTPH